AITLIVALLGVLWLVPPIFWFGQVDTEHQMMLGVIVVALMSGGSVSRATAPHGAHGDFRVCRRRLGHCQRTPLRQPRANPDRASGAECAHRPAARVRGERTRVAVAAR